MLSISKIMFHPKILFHMYVICQKALIPKKSPMLRAKSKVYLDSVAGYANTECVPAELKSYTSMTN